MQDKKNTVVWLFLEPGVAEEEVWPILSHLPGCWVLTDSLPDDDRPALLITRAPRGQAACRAGPTVEVPMGQLQSAADWLLQELGVSGLICQPLIEKEQQIQSLLRQRVTSPIYWLKERRPRPRLPLFGAPHPWSCFEKAQHAPKKLRQPPPVKPPSRPLTISLVTPSLEQSRYLERTLQSVLGQGYPWLHYWIQDGGSKDGSQAILKRYEPYIGGWESRPDTGQSQAINRGFERSQCDIMGWLNSDDILLTGALNFMASYFLEHPEVDVVYGQRVLLDAQDREIGRWLVPPYHGDILSWADLIPQETLFWRRRLWDKIGGSLDESFQFAMDWDLILRFREAGARIARLPRFLGGFRIHDRQKTSLSLATTGASEMSRLRKRSLGREVTPSEIFNACCPFYRRAKLVHLLYRLGWLSIP